MQYNLVSGDSHVDLSCIRATSSSKAPRSPQGQSSANPGNRRRPPLDRRRQRPRRRQRRRSRFQRPRPRHEKTHRPHVGRRPSTKAAPIPPSRTPPPGHGMDGIDGRGPLRHHRHRHAPQRQDTIAATYRTYNDWVADFCDSNPGRWYALACIPIHDPNLAAQELQRAADKGPIRALTSSPAKSLAHLHPRRLLGSAMGRRRQNKMSISFHVGGGRIPFPRRPTATPQTAPTPRTNSPTRASPNPSASSPASSGSSASSSAAPVKNSPTSSSSWRMRRRLVPFVLGRMDHIYLDSALDKKFDPPLSLLPSEYWFRQGSTTFQEESDVALMAHLIGEDNMCGFRLPPPRRRLARLQGHNPGNNGRPRPHSPHQNHPRQRRQPIPHGPITTVHSQKVGAPLVGALSYFSRATTNIYGHQTSFFRFQNVFTLRNLSMPVQS